MKKSAKVGRRPVKKAAAKKATAKTRKPRMLFHLDSMEVDNMGRVIIKDPWLTRQVTRAKGSRAKYLAANETCLLESFCPPDVSGDSCGGHPNIGCGCPPPDNLCTCVAQCGCTNSLCNCA